MTLAESMHALVYCGPGRPFELVAVPEVVLKPGEALVAVELATICGSDVHTVRGDRSADTPLVLGHEQVGRIVGFGPGATPRAVDGSALEIGARVVWGVAVDCGQCRYCLRGLPQKCESLRKYGHERMRRGWELSGGFASHVQLLARTPIVAVGELMPAEVAAPASCATATVMAAIEAAERIHPLEGAVLVVSGCGMLGLTAVAVAASRGAVVVASDTDPQRRAAALDFGATAVADGTREGLLAALATASGGSHGYGVALELSGASVAVQTLLETADIGAALVLVGSVSPAKPVALDPEQVVRRMLTVRGVHNYASRHLVEAIDFLATADQAAFAALVGTEHPLGDIEAALAQPLSGAAVRTALRPGPTTVVPSKG